MTKNRVGGVMLGLLVAVLILGIAVAIARDGHLFGALAFAAGTFWAAIGLYLVID